MKKSIIGYLLFVSLVFLLGLPFSTMADDWGGYTPEKPLTLKLAHWLPERMPPPLEYEPFAFMFERWAKAVEEESGNRVKFMIYPSESLVKLGDGMDALRLQICDLYLVFPPAHPGEFPSSMLLALPGLFPNSTISGMVTQKLYEEGLTAKDWKDVRVLWTASNNSQDVSTKNKQIKTLEDWKGIKIAAQGEPEASTIKALGAVPVGMPVYDQYIALERGTVDGVWNEFNGQVVFKFYEQSKFFTAAHGTARTFHYCMSLKTYNKLPPAIKTVIDRNSGMLWTVMTGKHFDNKVVTATGFLEDYCKQKEYAPIYYPAEEEVDKWKNAYKPVHEKTIQELEAKGYPAQKIYDRILVLAKRYEDYRLGGFANYKVQGLGTAK